MTMRLRGAQMIVRALEMEGVDVVFGYPGGTVIPLYDALYDSKIRHVLMRHEQAVGHAADGYARVTGRPGVCIVTSGPGATNIVTPLATAHMDSTPIIVIAGQVATKSMGTDAFQEADIFGCSMSMVKHSFLLKDASEIPTAVRGAFYIATSGRPGPVLIVLPVNVQNEEADFKYPHKVEFPGYHPEKLKDLSMWNQVVDCINGADRPVLIAGGGVIHSGASDILRSFADKFSIPVATTLMGKGTYPEGEHLSLGMAGMHGRVAANRAIMEADLVIGVGTRFSDRTTGNVSRFAQNAKIIHIDADPAEINKNLMAQYYLVGDAGEIISGLLEEVKARDRTEWLKRIELFKSKEGYSEAQALSPRCLLRTLRGLVDDRSVVTTEVGQNQMWAALHWDARIPRTFLSSGGLGTMGYGLPAAVGACIAGSGRPVVCISGDGSFLMNVQELETCVRYNLPVKVVVLNNSSLGMVRQWQELFWSGRYSATLEPPSCPLVEIARGFGVSGFQIRSPEEMKPTFQQALDLKGPAVVECLISTSEKVFPMVPPGGGMDEMIVEAQS